MSRAELPWIFVERREASRPVLFKAWKLRAVSAFFGKGEKGLRRFVSVRRSASVYAVCDTLGVSNTIEKGFASRTGLYFCRERVAQVWLEARF